MLWLDCDKIEQQQQQQRAGEVSDVCLFQGEIQAHVGVEQVSLVQQSTYSMYLSGRNKSDITATYSKRQHMKKRVHCVYPVRDTMTEV